MLSIVVVAAIAALLLKLSTPKTEKARFSGVYESPDFRKRRRDAAIDRSTDRMGWQ